MTLGFVTLWHRWDGERQAFTYSHYELGHVHTETPHDPFGRKWRSAKWKRQHGFLVPGSTPGVPKLITEQQLQTETK